MAYAEIDYGNGGRAEIWGDFTEDEATRRFCQMASDCFGIRKSIMKSELLKFSADQSMPKPWSDLSGAASMLSHNCGGGWGAKDIIVFDSDGEKIKSEWD